MCSSEGLGRLLPHLSNVVVESVERCTDTVVLRTRSRTLSARCTGCGKWSSRVHGRYERRLADAPLGGVPVVIVLLIRRFKCLAAACPAVTFAEQIPGLTRPHARCTPPLRGMLAHIAGVLAGRPGSRLARRLGVLVRKDTMLRLLRAAHVNETGQVRVLGVDEFALLKGAHLCDAVGRP
ncbi:transposase family protein [Streptomyces jumonjinensis]|uniref:transposase family protein n=1 Tax=Streptomyces jumonjinensis TaxID=1945 RepID=UPI00378F39EA